MFETPRPTTPRMPPRARKPAPQRERLTNKKVPLLPRRENGGTNLPHNPLISFTLRGALVPGGGIEPPTRGFSIHCSTPELPGHGRRQPSLRREVIGERVRAVQRGEAVSAGFFGVGLGLICRVLGVFGWHVIDLAEPFAEVDIGAAARAEGAVAGRCRLPADRARHCSTSLRGIRVRWRCNS